MFQSAWMHTAAQALESGESEDELPFQSGEFTWHLSPMKQEHQEHLACGAAGVKELLCGLHHNSTYCDVSTLRLVAVQEGFKQGFENARLILFGE